MLKTERARSLAGLLEFLADEIRVLADRVVELENALCKAIDNIEDSGLKEELLKVFHGDDDDG